MIRRIPLWTWFLVGLGALLLLSESVYRVDETKQAIVLRLGKPDRIVNGYDPRETVGRTGAGLVAKIPFFESVIFVDKRIRNLDMPVQTVLSTDQLRLVVDAYARYRITDPLRMYITRGNEEAVAQQLANVLGSRLRNELGKQPFSALLSPERGELMERIQAAVNEEARVVGAEIVDLRIKRADLPPGTPLESAFARMRTAREQEARTIRAQGFKQAQLVRAEADAEAARIYAQSFGRDPEFYAFYRAMQAYREAFKTGDANLVLSPDNDFLREFQSGGRAR
ncbi:MAG: protease modulator HflC [Sphingomonadaceae bacterium]